MSALDILAELATIFAVTMLLLVVVALLMGERP